MSVANLQEMLLSYTMRKSELINDMTTIMARKQIATRDSLDLMNNAVQQRLSLNEQLANDPTLVDNVDYQAQKDEAEASYELELAKINAWEDSLNEQQMVKESELKAIEGYEESVQALLKENIKKEFKYGDGKGE